MQVLSSEDARCPEFPEHIPPEQFESEGEFCEPFSKSGCSVTPDPNPVAGCPAGLGFPSVAGHGGCASAIFSRHGWVHGKCCAGEIGHVGTAVVQPPGQNYMDLGVFPSLSECLEARCPVGPLEELPKCRCRFPSHVCPARGSNACIEAPVYQLNTGVSCNPSGTYHLSVEACHALCNLDNDCTGFEVEAQSLKKCRLFTKWSRCTAPVYGMLARGHTYTKPQKHEERPPSETAWISVGIVTVLFVPIVTLLVVVFWLPV